MLLTRGNFREDHEDDTNTKRLHENEGIDAGRGCVRTSFRDFLEFRAADFRAAELSVETRASVAVLLLRFTLLALLTFHVYKITQITKKYHGSTGKSYS